jgi:hypothetical protein
LVGIGVGAARCSVMFLARSDVLAIPSSAVNQISGEESSFIDHKTRVFDRLAPEFEIALFPPVAVGYGRASEVLSPPRIRGQ